MRQTCFGGLDRHQIDDQFWRKRIGDSTDESDVILRSGDVWETVQVHPFQVQRQCNQDFNPPLLLLLLSMTLAGQSNICQMASFSAKRCYTSRERSPERLRIMADALKVGENCL